MTRQAFKERRKHKRFKVRNGAFVTVTPDLTTVGRIINISRGGLTFRHNKPIDYVGKSFEMDIFYLRHGYCIEKVPSTIVSQFDVENDAITGLPRTVQCGVQFAELTDMQLTRMDNFIQLFEDRRLKNNRRRITNPDYNGPERRSGIERREQPI